VLRPGLDPTAIFENLFAAIAKVKRPARAAVYGKAGPLLREWRR